MERVTICFVKKKGVFCRFLGTYMPCLKKTKPKFAWPTRAGWVGWGEKYRPRLFPAVHHVPEPQNPRDHLDQSGARAPCTTPAQGRIWPIVGGEFLHKGAKTTRRPAAASLIRFRFQLHVWEDWAESGHPVACCIPTCNCWKNPALWYIRKTWKLFHLIRWIASLVLL